MKDENRSWHEPSTFQMPFEFQCQISQLDANIMHILINAYTQTMENRLLDSDWISIALDGTQSQNQSNEPPLGDSLLFKSDLMTLLSPTLPPDPGGGGFNWLVHNIYSALSQSWGQGLLLLIDLPVMNSSSDINYQLTYSES